MIFLATDFGPNGPYTGQVKARIAREAPGIEVIDLFADLPKFQPRCAAYLLSAYADVLAAGDILLAVVDPGVGGDRLPLIIQADGCIYVGPNNGLFELIARRAAEVSCQKITWRPAQLSASFHGRDLFAPVAAQLAKGMAVAAESCVPAACHAWPDDLPVIIYIDHYGNGMTGLRASTLEAGAMLEVSGVRLNRARTFGDCPEGSAFWYENANGLAEVAVNGASASDRLNLEPGVEIKICPPG
ncbi:MAG: SAM hydrolase/SAM-dependent halogenase family protein [Geminicoccaceae bacterium]